MNTNYKYSYRYSGWWHKSKQKIKDLSTDPRNRIYFGLALHDILHLLIAQMDPIQIGDYWVDGVSGLNINIFNHPPNFVPQYDGGIFDEIRVAIHEVIVLPSWISIIRYLEWCRWMIVSGINPIWVTYQHYTAYKKWLDERNCPCDSKKT